MFAGLLGFLLVFGLGGIMGYLYRDFEYNNLTEKPKEDTNAR